MATMTLDSAEEIKRRISELNLEHRDLDRAIEALEQNPLHDELQLKRLKKRKLMLEGPDLHAAAPAGPRHSRLAKSRNNSPGPSPPAPRGEAALRPYNGGFPARKPASRMRKRPSSAPSRSPSSPAWAALAYWAGAAATPAPPALPPPQRQPPPRKAWSSRRRGSPW